MSWVLDEEVLAVLAALLLVSSVFAVAQLYNAGRGEAFSELGLLGPEGKIGGYPKEVPAGTPFKLNIYIGNHEWKAMYYKILVKVGTINSTINETTPMPQPPIMEIRRTLPHNSSIIIPINITLYKEMENARLVFEMWILNETSKKFEYHERWNQLWLNVTKPPGVEVTPSYPKPLNPEIESKLIEGYLSIRRAETSGGNITQMIQLLNKAIEQAEYGNESEAENLINQILELEPTIIKLGREAERNRFYMNLASLISAAAIGTALLLYFRHNIWLLWAKYHSEFEIALNKRSGKSGNPDPHEAKIKRLLKSLNEPKVKSIIELSERIKLKNHEAARAVYKLTRTGAVRLIDPNPPETFGGYILSRYNLGFAISTILVALTIISIYTSHLHQILSIMRIILGTVFTLFMPGYSLIETLYPSETDLKPLERLALSIGLSLALVPLIGLILNYTPWGIRLTPILTALSALTLTLLTISAYRKFQLLKLKVLAENG